MKELMLITWSEQPTNEPMVLFQKHIEGVNHSFTFLYCLNSSSQSDDNVYVITTRSSWGKSTQHLGTHAFV